MLRSGRPGQGSVRGLPRVGAGWVLPKSPLRLLERRNRAAFAGRSSSERSPNGEVVRKPLYGGPWIGYPVRARTAKKEILVYISLHNVGLSRRMYDDISPN